MKAKICEICRLKEFKRTYKTELKALWEDFLISEYKGHTYNDFVLLKYVEMQKKMVHFDRVKLINIVFDKVHLQISNLDMRLKLKRGVRPWREPHYKALIKHNRELINAYNGLILKTLGGAIYHSG